MILGVDELCKRTQLSRPTITKLRKTDSFPKPYMIGFRKLAWNEVEVDAWLRGEYNPKPIDVETVPVLRKEPPKPVKKRFVAPTEAELIDYFTEKGSSSEEASLFFNYYESNGWKVGKNLMKSWPNAASGWIKRNSKNERKFNRPSSSNSVQSQLAEIERQERAEREQEINPAFTRETRSPLWPKGS